MTRRELEVKDMNEIRMILDESKVMHLGLVDDGMPYIVPMNYGYVMEEGKLTLYLHSSVKGYKLDVMAKNPLCCFEMETGLEPFEGDVACKYGIAYWSLMGRGKISFVEDVEEKKQAMTILMRTQTAKEFEFNDKLVGVVTVLRIDVSEYTAKHRPLPKR